MKGKYAILYFVKYPEAGKVKTRLGEVIGMQKAAELYRRITLKNYDILMDLPAKHFDLWVTFDPPSKKAEIEEGLSLASRYFPQAGEDLGERLTNAFQAAFAEKYDGVIALGSDTLFLGTKHLEYARTQLESHDVVLGPTKDGGYYLIGVSKPTPELFKDIPWSTTETAKATKARAAAQKLDLFEIETLEDLDTEADLRAHEKGSFA